MEETPMSDDRLLEQPFQIFALSGSLRAKSANTAVLHALQAIAPANVTLAVSNQIDALPHFNPDLDGEDATPPLAVQELRARIGQADGLLISSPEYAHGVPGVLKNALDWLVSSREFAGTPVALVNIAPRATFVHAALSETLRTMDGRLISDAALTIALPRSGLTLADMLADQQIAQDLRAALAAFVEAIAIQRARPAAG
jgi:NAD(P)H-dependent FMN reductase